MLEKAVLWISRHPMSEEQFADLERVMGGKVRLIVWPKTVDDVEQLRPQLEQADAAAAVLPPELLEQLLAMAGDKPVLLATSLRAPTGRWLERPDGQREQEFAFVHAGWKQLLEMKVRTKDL